MLGAMDLGIANDRERAGDEQAAQILRVLVSRYDMVLFVCGQRP
jgi:hypothetical protein